MKRVRLPITDKDIRKLKTGDEVLLAGTVYTARDAAHKRMVEKLPFDIKGQAIYYCGPTPAKPGQIIGSCGPTTSSRMDKFSSILLNKGLKTIIGKGSVGVSVISAIKKNRAVYFIAPGGCGALLSEAVKKSKLVAYEDLGCEAIYELEISNFPAIVAVDAEGRSLYK